MSRQAVAESYPAVPDGFSLMREYDPDTGLNYFRVKFTAQMEQVITDELMASLNFTSEQLWGTVARELESAIMRRFR